MNTETKNAKYENERLFGATVDPFKNYYATLFIRNTLKAIGLQDINDTDFYRTICNYITRDEVIALYNNVLPSKERAILEQTKHVRTPPDVDEDPDDILAYLGRKIPTRQKMIKRLYAYMGMRMKAYEEMMAVKDRKISILEQRFLEMKQVFELTDKEMDILMAVFFTGNHIMDLGDFDLNAYRNGGKLQCLARMVAQNEIETATLLNENHTIGKFRLLDNDCDMDNTFFAYLSGISPKPLTERFWVKYTGEALPWSFHGKVAEKHGAVLERMIRSKTPDTGISVLLFGVAGSGKTSFAASLAKDLGKDLYFIAQHDDDDRRMSYSPAFRYAALAVAQKQLDTERCILVIDECDKMVENRSLGGGFLSFLGLETPGSRDGETKGQLNTVIDQNKHAVLWICNSKQDAIDPSSRRRFDYSIFFDDLSDSTRKHIWENALKFYHQEGMLSDAFLDTISARYRVNPGGINVAVKNAALTAAKGTVSEFENEVMVYLKAHCALLGIAENPIDKLEPAKDYSLDGLNIRSGIKLPRLIDACRTFLSKLEDVSSGRDQPRMNLLLFGVPGSGKTEFVKYLAKQLNKTLSIKNASQLLNEYVGGTEQRIAAAFAEAEANNDILFIDEGDSLLSARTGAVRNWEVSQVNTLLTEMERFKGIFIVSTNMIQRLDQAALRRFSFRLHFDYLENEGKEIFFKAYFAPLGMPELSDKEKDALHAIDQLTPSDFRNTRQQFYYLEDTTLTNMEIIEALHAEVTSKTSGENYTGLGRIASRIGF